MSAPCRCGGFKVLVASDGWQTFPCACQPDEDRWVAAGIPPFYHHAVPSDLPGEELFSSRLLWGPAGTGKTFEAIRILKRHARARNGGRFVDLAQLEDERRTSIRTEGVLPGENLFSAPFLVADDLCRRPRITPFWEEFLSELIRQRYNAALPTVWTSNHSPADLVTILGNHLVGRILETCGPRVHALGGRDRRLAGAALATGPAESSFEIRHNSGAN